MMVLEPVSETTGSVPSGWMSPMRLQGSLDDAMAVEIDEEGLHDCLTVHSIAPVA